MPPPGPVPRHPVGLHARRDSTRPAESHPARLRHPDLAGVSAEPTHLLGFDGDDLESLVSAGLAPRRPPGWVASVEERSHRLSEVPQRLLLHHLRACPQPVMLCPRLSELSALLQVARRAHPARTPVRMLLDREIPHVAGMGAVLPQNHFLGGCEGQPIPRHTNTLSTSTDIFRRDYVAFLPRPEGGRGVSGSRS